MKSAGDMDKENEAVILPEAVKVNFDGIPSFLQGYPFVCWRYEEVDGDVKKPPINPRTGKRANVAEQSTWGSLDEAKEAYLTGKWGKMNGIGIVLVEDSGLVAIDMDDCIENGKIKPHAMDIISMLNTYTEFSPSIKIGEKLPSGVHLWVKGKVPGKFCRNDYLKVEIYQRRRYMSVTGHMLNGNRDYLREDQDRLTALYNELFAYDESKRDTGGGYGERSAFYSNVTLERALERAYRASYTDKFRRFYEGDSSLWEAEGAEYKSQSNADFVLVLFLLRVTNNNKAQVDELFRRSGLMRPKWDRRVNKSETYGQRTIKRALEVRLRS